MFGIGNLFQIFGVPSNVAHLRYDSIASGHLCMSRSPITFQMDGIVVTFRLHEKPLTAMRSFD